MINRVLVFPETVAYGTRKKKKIKKNLNKKYLRKKLKRKIGKK